MLLTILKAGVVLLLLALPNACSGQCNGNTGCFPALGNLAFGRNVLVTSTCAGEFCSSGTNTLIACNGSEYQSTSINDGNEDTFWVSEVGSSNLSLPVIIRLDFEAAVLFDSMTMLWQSSRPEAMILERSSDNGNTWTPYRYYSQNCTGDFNLDDSLVTPVVNFSGESAICTSQESFFTPQSGGMVSKVFCCQRCLMLLMVKSNSIF